MANEAIRTAPRRKPRAQQPAQPATGSDQRPRYGFDEYAGSVLGTGTYGTMRNREPGFRSGPLKGQTMGQAKETVRRSYASGNLIDPMADQQPKHGLDWLKANQTIARPDRPLPAPPTKTKAGWEERARGSDVVSPQETAATDAFNREQQDLAGGGGAPQPQARRAVPGIGPGMIAGRASGPTGAIPEAQGGFQPLGVGARAFPATPSAAPSPKPVAQAAEPKPFAASPALPEGQWSDPNEVKWTGMETVSPTPETFQAPPAAGMLGKPAARKAVQPQPEPYSGPGIALPSGFDATRGGSPMPNLGIGDAPQVQSQVKPPDPLKRAQNQGVKQTKPVAPPQSSPLVKRSMPTKIAPGLVG